jgi:hypothetical protein
MMVCERFVFVFGQGGGHQSCLGKPYMKYTDSTLAFMMDRMALRSAAIVLSSTKVMWWEP